MNELPFQKSSFGKPPPVGNLSILEHLVSSYKLWHSYSPHIPKTARYTLAEKIDRVFLETIELLFAASKSAKRVKLDALQQASVKFELLKFLLQILWEIRALDNSKYAVLAEPLNHIGKMLGGWIRQTLTQLQTAEHSR